MDVKEGGKEGRGGEGEEEEGGKTEEDCGLEGEWEGEKGKKKGREVF